MSDIVKKKDYVIPSIEDIYNQTDLSESSERIKLNVLLNQTPPDSWIKEHPSSTENKKIYYIPIDKIEYMLTRIFIDWYVEIREVKLIANSVAVTVRLHYKDPITSQWKFNDGVGAQKLQVDKGAKAADLSALKQNALELALPSAKSYAIKDAAEMIGKLFGKDLNRKDTLNYNSMLDKANSLDERIENILEK